MKKIILSSLLIMVLLFTVTACGNSDKDASDTQPQTQTMVGTIMEATMDTIVVKDNDGNEYTFSTQNAEMDIKNGLELGNWVEVTYEGDSGDGSAVLTATKVVDDADNIKEEQKKVEITAMEATMYTTVSVHVRASYTTDSDILATLKQGEEVKVTGKSNNDWYRIDYKGKDGYIHSGYLSKDKPKKTTDATAPSKSKTTQSTTAATKSTEGTTAANVSTQKAYGVIKSVKNHTIVVTMDEKDYTLNIMTAKIKLTNGLATGETVKIVYSGNLDKNPTVVEISDSDL